MIKNVIQGQVDLFISDDEYPEQWNLIGLNEALSPFHLNHIYLENDDKDKLTKEKLVERIYEKARAFYDEKEKEIGSETLRELERVILLRVVDQKWMDHLDNMEQMRQGISLRAYGQRDPILEYKNLSYDMFEEMNYNILFDTIKGLFNLRVETHMEREAVATPISTNKDESLGKQPKKRSEPKIGRNDECPCGSGKKYKQCCGSNN